MCNVWTVTDLINTDNEPVTGSDLDVAAALNRWFSLASDAAHVQIDTVVHQLVQSLHTGKARSGAETFLGVRVEVAECSSCLLPIDVQSETYPELCEDCGLAALAEDYAEDSRNG